MITEQQKQRKEVEVEGISGPSFPWFWYGIAPALISSYECRSATMNTPGYPQWSRGESDAGLFCLYSVLFAQTPKFISLFIFNSLKKY
jgi:hypothetical protein